MRGFRPVAAPGFGDAAGRAFFAGRDRPEVELLYDPSHAAGSRGVAILATLLMVMLGGAWVPTFIFPGWLQRVTLIVPVRWAVDGLDAMTWRGLPLSAAIGPVAVLVGFAAVFGTVAVSRFRWDEV